MTAALGRFEPQNEIQLREGLDKGRTPGRGFSANDPYIQRLPESQLDILIEHYGGASQRHVW
jgi:hypothetical protein